MAFDRAAHMREVQKKGQEAIRARSATKRLLEAAAAVVAADPIADVPAELPVYDPESLAVQTYSAEEGQGFIQGKNLFTAAGKFVRELPKERWYITTPEMERNNKIARAKWRAMLRGRIAAKQGPALPEKLLEAHKENNRALAAESLAE